MVPQPVDPLVTAFFAGKVRNYRTFVFLLSFAAKRLLRVIERDERFEMVVFKKT